MKVLILYAHHSRDNYLEFFCRAIDKRNTNIPFKVLVGSHRMVEVTGKTSMPILQVENKGRDFCTWAQMIESVGIDEMNKQGFTHVLFLNDTAAGPFCHEWLERYDEIFKKDEKLAIVGSTISSSHHWGFPCWHVQSYAYMIPLKHWSVAKHYFHASDLDRKKSIELEVGLSQYVLKEGYSIACTAPVNSYITAERKGIFSSKEKHARGGMHCEPISPVQLVFSKNTNPETDRMIYEINKARNILNR